MDQGRGSTNHAGLGNHRGRSSSNRMLILSIGVGIRSSHDSIITHAHHLGIGRRICIIMIITTCSISVAMRGGSDRRAHRGR